VRIGVAADRAAAVPCMAATMDSPRLGDDCASGIPVNGAAVRPVARLPGWPPAVVVWWPAVAPAAVSRAVIRLSALTAATIMSWSPWKTINGMELPAVGDPPVCIAAKAEATVARWRRRPKQAAGVWAAGQHRTLCHVRTDLEAVRADTRGTTAKTWWAGGQKAVSVKPRTGQIRSG
jgi:hypothetical protein